MLQNNNFNTKQIKKEGQSINKKGKESNNESGDNTTANSQQPSRPRTSRGNRPSSKVGRSGPTGGGNSAIGFHSNIPNHHLLYNNLDNMPLHNRSVNEVIESPRSKKRKLSKGRISPNTFAPHHQRQPSAIIKQQNPQRNSSLEGEQIKLNDKSRPHSAKLKKKNNKSAERGK